MGFTLVELLVVIVIVALVSAAALPAIVGAYRGSGVTAGAGLLGAALSGARDRATGSAGPAGIRLLPAASLGSVPPDPAKAWAADRWVELAAAPAYSAGRCSAYPGVAYPAAVTGPRACLVLEESPGEWVQSGGAWVYMPVEPTNWWWLVRLGERVRVGAAEYTVCGPAVLANPEAFTNVGDPSSASPLTRTVVAPDGVTRADITPQFLLLTNGRDDDRDGFVDEGYDGIDNDGLLGVDDANEWEQEAWLPAQAGGGVGLAYAIRRRPVPTGPAYALPSGVVVDLTTWSGTRERSRCNVDGTTGAADVLVDRFGVPAWDSVYGTPAAAGLSSGWLHLWVCGVADLRDPDPLVTTGCRLPTPGSGLLGAARVVSLSRAGRVTSTEPGNGDAADPSAVTRAIEH